MFQKAVKYNLFLRLSLAGPSGSGKTYTALTLATALANGKPVAVIDTERGSASKYADLFNFDVLELDSFHPEKFIQGIQEAQEGGYAVLVIDSLSHAWNGPGGLLEIVEGITQRSASKNSFSAWGQATPMQNKLIDAITRSKLHIIATMRSKQEYIIESVNGKSTPKKVGMAPIQRDGMEYEFDIAADMDIDNTLIIQKSRCPALSGMIIPKPDGQVVEILKEWLSGVPAPQINSSEVDALISRWARICQITDEDIAARWPKYKKYILKSEVADPDLKPHHVAQINGDLIQREKAALQAVAGK